LVLKKGYTSIQTRYFRGGIHHFPQRILANYQPGGKHLLFIKTRTPYHAVLKIKTGKLLS
jgi:hypothetical protein